MSLLLVFVLPNLDFCWLMFFGVFHRIWNHEEATLLNSFDNHDFPDKGISKLCLVNELDDSLLLDASCTFLYCLILFILFSNYCKSI